MISNDLKFSTVVSEMQEDDYVTCKTDEEIIKKYALLVGDNPLKKLMEA